MADVSAPGMGDECIDLPPGFRFHPTDEEIIKFYLTQKVLNNSFSSRAIAEADLNKTEPWDLPRKAKMGEKEWYFFCQRDRKYPTGMRTNRATESGYWKATGKDKEIYQAKECLVGMKKTLVFYRGRAPKGEKTNWVMHEYRLEGKFFYHSHSISAKDEWVVCRVFHKSSGLRKSPTEDLLDYSILPPLSDPPYFNNDGSKGEFKGTTTTSRALDGIQASHFSNGMKDEGDKKSFLPNNSNINNQGNFYNPPQNPFTSFQTSLANSLWSFSGSVNLDYLNNTGPGLIGPTNERYGSKIQFKVDQVSNQSIVSQDTGVSTDQTPEISSHDSIKEIDNNRCYEDLECLWNY